MTGPGSWPDRGNLQSREVVNHPPNSCEFPLISPRKGGIPDGIKNGESSAEKIAVVAGRFADASRVIGAVAKVLLLQPKRHLLGFGRGPAHLAT